MIRLTLISPRTMPFGRTERTAAFRLMQQSEWRLPTTGLGMRRHCYRWKPKTAVGSTAAVSAMPSERRLLAQPGRAGGQAAGPLSGIMRLSFFSCANGTCGRTNANKSLLRVHCVSFAIGTLISERARTGPYVRLSRTRLLPRILTAFRTRCGACDARSRFCALASVAGSSACFG
jgi:hypothetical protein